MAQSYGIIVTRDCSGITLNNSFLLLSSVVPFSVGLLTLDQLTNGSLPAHPGSILGTAALLDSSDYSSGNVEHIGQYIEIV